LRNDVIERTVNDTLLTIADYILQMIEKSRKQKDVDMKELMAQEMNHFQRDHPSLSLEEKEEAEYELYYALIKERQPELFELKGNVVETFPIDKDKSVFHIYQSNDIFYGVYQQDLKEAHQITRSFSSKEELLQTTFGTSQFEKFRGRSLFLKDEQTFALHSNKHFRLNLVKKYKTLDTFENIQQARSSIVREELNNDPKLRKHALRRSLEEHHIPSDLLGKVVTLRTISKENEGINLSFEENGKEREIKLPDLDEKWLERISANPKMKAIFDELVMDSHSVAEGALAFYGMEINKELQTKQQNFEVISDEEGSYIGKVSGDGSVKKFSPYFSEEEAEKQLGNLNKHLQLENQKERLDEVESDIDFIDISEKTKEVEQ
jgi:hypothetical protein